MVEKWWWHIDGEIEDCMGYITGVWEKKEEKPQIMRMEIVLSEEKAKLHGIDVNKGYKAIDDYLKIEEYLNLDKEYMNVLKMIIVSLHLALQSHNYLKQNGFLC